jgi:DNA-binding IclR family transcriptional regulator
MIKKREKTKYTIRSVSRAIDLLEQFLGDDVEIGLTDLSRRLKLPKNNIFRLLATLQLRNYVEQNATNEKYHLGFKTVELGQMVSRQFGAFSNSKPVLERLVKDCNETAVVSVLKDYSMVNLDLVECDHHLRVRPRIGVQLPAYCTAAGKSQIAHFAEEKLKHYACDYHFHQFTPYTITDPKQWKSQLQQVALQGYAIENEELDLGVRSVGAPIRDFASRIIGAVTLSGPSQRFNDERIKNELIPLVMKGAADISCAL